MNRINSRLVALALGAAVTAGASIPAKAAYFDVPLPTNAYITFGGLEWAWAYPVPAASPYYPPMDLSYQSTQGWRLPTVEELAVAPLATNFLFAGANVPFAVNDPITSALFLATNINYATAASAGACATPYFSTKWLHCDWQDGNGQPNQPWAGLPGALDFADQLVVRGAAVPEPATVGLLFLSLGAIGLVTRRKQA